MDIIKTIYLLIRAFLVPRLVLAAENLALRQQVVVYKHTIKRPKLRTRDRIFWVWLSRLWPNWRSALAIVQPETVIRWHRQGFKLYWKWKSGARKPGRPPVKREIRDLIRDMSRDNPFWGAPRILSELLLLGYHVAERTVAKYTVRTRKPPSQTWRTFPANHVADVAACDFFTVPTVTFRVLYVFVVLRHDRRQVVHFNVTDHPYAQWAAQQIIQAFPHEEAPRFLLRDRDGTYGEYFTKRITDMGTDEVPIAPHAPWQNPYCERMIGSIRRDCLDHVIVLNERHLYRILADYFHYYHEARPHLSLERNSPVPRRVEPPSEGQVVAVPQVGGLHHRYTRRAA